MTFFFFPAYGFKTTRKYLKIHITRTFLLPAPTTVCGKINTLSLGNWPEITVIIFIISEGCSFVFYLFVDGTCNNCWKKPFLGGQSWIVLIKENEQPNLKRAVLSISFFSTAP